ncbi:MAG: YihY/virulence factor BrkB family protein [Clostridiales bacterium]|nr:YihY/virulence factor BrkB family protein [Candidatus Crickella equi]
MDEAKHAKPIEDNTSDTTEKKLPLTFTRLVKMGFHVWRQFDDPYYAGFAAQIAYFFFMSSIPIIIVLTQVLGVFDVSMDFIKEWLEAHLSTQMNGALEGIFSASSTAIANVLMIVLALWAASSLEFSLSRLTTYTLTRGKYRFNWFTERAKAIPMALLMLFAVAFALSVYVYGEMVATSIFKSEFFANLIASLRTPVLAAVFFVVVTANYYISPRIRVPIRAILPGSIVATFGIMIVTWIYSLYQEKAVTYNLLYGAFSTIVAILLWFYLISWVICIGMMFNKSWDIIMKRKRLTKEMLKSYVIDRYGETAGEETWNKIYIGEKDVFDPKLDTLAVKFSKKFDPGYAEKHARELQELKEEMAIKEWVEKEIQEEIEEKKYNGA